MNAAIFQPERNPFGQPITVHANGRYIAADTQPVLQNNRVLLPMRAAAEAIGASVEWHSANNCITVQKDNSTACFYVGNHTYNRTGCKNTPTLHQPFKTAEPSSQSAPLPKPLTPTSNGMRTYMTSKSPSPALTKPHQPYQAAYLQTSTTSSKNTRSPYKTCNRSEGLPILNPEIILRNAICFKTADR